LHAGNERVARVIVPISSALAHHVLKTALATTIGSLHSIKMDEINRLRSLAAKCRFLARQVEQPTKKTLLDAANDYEQEAFALERED
jgi:hypothetical protein